jgi:hypothetical protein
MSLLIRSYLQPFRNKNLAIIYGSIFLGVFANSFLMLYIALDTVKLGWLGMTAYLYGWFLVSGFVLFPFYYFLFTRHKRKWFISGVIGSQIFGLLLFLLTDISQTPWGVGITLALFVTGYFQMCHANLSGHNSKSEVGFEVSLAKAITNIGGLFGASLAGFIILGGDKPVLLGIAFLGIVCSTIGLSITLPRIHPTKEDGNFDPTSIHVTPLLQTFCKDLPMTCGTFMEAFWESFSSLLMPAYLILAGIGTTMIGLIFGVQGIVVAMAIPLAGKLIHDGKGKEFQLAASLGGLSLVLLLLPLNAVVMLGSHVLRAMSKFFYHGGLESRWYGDKSFTQIFVRELNLTLARLVSIPLACWLCFQHQFLFLAVGFIVALLLWPVGKWAILSRS